MKIKGIKTEDFCNYKVPSMFILFPTCTWKCEYDCGLKVCQNNKLANLPTIDVSTKSIVKLYCENSITKAIVCGGLEPLDSFDDLLEFISQIRNICDDDVVVYTGYKEEEVVDKITQLSNFKNIIVKFGRYVPNQKSVYDSTLGINLASSNQYSKRIS